MKADNKSLISENKELAKEKQVLFDRLKDARSQVIKDVVGKIEKWLSDVFPISLLKRGLIKEIKSLEDKDG